MTTTSPPTRPPRRPASVSSAGTVARSASAVAKETSTPSANTPSGTTLVAKGSISRTSPSPKATPPIRRATANSSRPSSSLSNQREAVSKESTPSKLKENGVRASPEGGELGHPATQGNHEELLLRIQDLDGTVSTLATENASLQTSLSQAEARMAELYADQSRTEDELAVRNELAEKLRSQLREVEKEKRDLTRRYNEQTAAFEAERVSFYDNEEHLKSRIQALTQSRKEHHTTPRKPRHSAMDETASIVSEAEYAPLAPPEGETSGPAGNNRSHGNADTTSGQEESEDDNEPAEMTALRLELSTLSTSHASLQSTLHLLQSQLLDLQRVNAELQEENEGWKVLVQQRTLAGTFDILTLGGANSESAAISGSIDDSASMKSNTRNALDQVSEMDEIAYEATQGREGLDSSLDPDLALTEGVPPHIGRSLDSELNASQLDTSTPSRRTRRKGTIGPGDINGPEGETLADLPITGPGLDLAAELGRAQNADGFIDGATGTSATPKKPLTAEETQRKNEMDALKTEVKNLKDANKALSLYASKIIDRIIATEGFEDVLAVDFQEKAKGRENKTTPKKGARPGSLMFGMSETSLGASPRPLPPKEKLTTFESIGLSATGKQAARTNNGPAPPPPPPKQAPPADDPRRSRRSMSFDWRGFSLFGGNGQAQEQTSQPILKPLNLRPGAATGGGSARKLDTMEDEEDRIERERLRATMRLMGIDAANNQHAAAAASAQLRPLNTGAVSGSQGQTPPSPKTAVAPTSNNRWSFFGKKNDTASNSSSSIANNDNYNYTFPPAAPTSLTTEALKQAEVESHIAALDARERVVKEEIAKGGAGGFTELSGLSGPGGQRKRIGEEWRNRRSSGYAGLSGGGLSRSQSLRNSKEGSEAGSANTVWSAGNDDD
ncbi:hypothetical protein M408DRAFT_332190 [Serendipita vermifera MAFF 305830]|uniref:Uncharacterized protein n=1 Tax=Serendipita vermifera MAFF 305830 TaxID=933852 RepID=A0A0C3AUJ4_SERVB|nr:hypothetical protein M408DRAFT_332190 [Serendipita vermifera MAFF 305830]